MSPNPSTSSPRPPGKGKEEAPGDTGLVLMKKRSRALAKKSAQSSRATQNADKLLQGSSSTGTAGVAETALPMYGKYRGTVVDNDDPRNMGRIVAHVPAISTNPLPWALPNVPFAGQGVGFFAPPPIGANVWIEFEGGDIGHPIWTGCFWGEGEAPPRPATPGMVMLKTNQGIDIQCGANTVEIKPASIKLMNGTAASIVLLPDSVNINNGALEVM